MKALIFILFFAAIFAFTVENPFEDEDYDAGLLKIKEDQDIFYWLVKSKNNPNEDPLVVWFAGGPGCSDSLAIFLENGPWTINSDLNLSKNPHSWNKVANILYLDQPLGTGFSSISNPEDLPKNSETVAEDFYTFIVSFMEKFPEFKGRDFYLTGESFSGHMIPAISKKIIEEENQDINLVSIALGDPWIDPSVQYPSYADYSIEQNLVGSLHSLFLKTGFWVCEQLIQLNFKDLGFQECQYMMLSAVGGQENPKFNIYNIKQDPSIFSNAMIRLAQFMNQPKIKEILKVGNKDWEACNQQIMLNFIQDSMEDFSSIVKFSMDHEVKVLAYYGELDYLCNHLGGEAWVRKLSQGESSENLAYFTVEDAGHMVTFDRPEFSLEILKGIIKGDYWN